jgi:hypothetical protein
MKTSQNSFKLNPTENSTNPWDVSHVIHYTRLMCTSLSSRQKINCRISLHSCFFTEWITLTVDQSKLLSPLPCCCHHPSLCSLRRKGCFYLIRESRDGFFGFGNWMKILSRDGKLKLCNDISQRREGEEGILFQPIKINRSIFITISHRDSS